MNAASRKIEQEPNVSSKICSIDITLLCGFDCVIMYYSMTTVLPSERRTIDKDGTRTERVVQELFDRYDTAL